MSEVLGLSVDSFCLIIAGGFMVINKGIKVCLSPTCTICLGLIWFLLEYGGVSICLWHLLDRHRLLYKSR